MTMQMLYLTLVLLLFGLPNSQLIRNCNAQGSPNISPAESSSNTTESSAGDIVIGNNGATPVEGGSQVEVTPAGSKGEAAPTPPSPEVQPKAPQSPPETPESIATEAQTEAPTTQHPCADVVCGNGGACNVDDGGAISCKCVPGWTGSNCTEGE